MKEEELEGQVYKQIDELYENLDSLGVTVSGDYRSELPSVKTTEGCSNYYPIENTIYINPNDEKLEDIIAEESMHFLDTATKGEVGSNVKTTLKYPYIDEFIGAAGRLFEGTSKDVRLPEKEVRKDLKKIEKETEVLEKLKKNDYQQIKKLIETSEDERTIEEKQGLNEFYKHFERLYSKNLEEFNEKNILIFLEAYYHCCNLARSSILAHQKGYDLAQKVHETDGGIKGFFEKYPNFLLQSYEKTGRDIESFLSV